MMGIEQPKRIHSRLFSLPKLGKSAEEYEDACAIDEPAGIYAVADGASDSAFSQVWAELLVQRFLTGLPAEDSPQAWRAWVQPAQEIWKAVVNSDPLPWYVQSKVREGAYATCVALVLRRGPTAGAPGHWAALAIGDSCLFHVQTSGGGTPDASTSGFPLTRPEDFTNHPLAVSSNPQANEHVWSRVATARGTWQPGDTFVLATDALSEWLLREVVPKQSWSRVLSLADAPDDTAFHQLIETERNDGRLHNDDVTLLIVRVRDSAGDAEGGDGDVADV